MYNFVPSSNKYAKLIFVTSASGVTPPAASIALITLEPSFSFTIPWFTTCPVICTTISILSSSIILVSFVFSFEISKYE